MKPHLIMFGGPADGATYVYPYGEGRPPDYWYVPVLTAMSYQHPDQLQDTVASPCHIYQLIYNQGAPSLDDQGRYRYQYTRTANR